MCIITARTRNVRAGGGRKAVTYVDLTAKEALPLWISRVSLAGKRGASELTALSGAALDTSIPNVPFEDRLEYHA